MSAAAVTTEIVTVSAVLGVGSILGQYVASSKDRRETVHARTIPVPVRAA